MADFCLPCWNRLNGMDVKRWQVILTPWQELCEGCGEYRHTIMDFRSEWRFPWI